MAGQRPERPVRRRRKEDRPSELTAAALELFAEKGYAATRLDDVAARAGVSKGTLYLYFGGKEALFNAVVREGLVSALSQWKEWPENYTGRASDLLREVLLSFWRVIGSGEVGGLLKLVLSEAGNFPEIARFYHDEVIARGAALVHKVVAYGVARGEFRTLNPDAAAHIMLAPLLMRTIWEHSLACGAPSVPPERYLAECFDLMRAGLVPPAILSNRKASYFESACRESST